MPILEATQLHLKGVAPDDPSLLKNLSTVRGILNTHSQFYSCIEDPTVIFIFGLWPSLEAHHEFLASPRAAEVLGPQDGMLEFKWAVHMELDAMASLPLEAPVMSLTRRTVKQYDVDAYDNVVATEKQAVLDSSKYKVASGWRVDAAPGAHEALLFTGWDNTQAHAAFRAEWTDWNCPAATNQVYEELDIYHARNMERSPR